MRAAATAAVLVAGVVVATGFVPDSAAPVPAAMQGAGAAPVAAAEPDVCGTARGASTAAGLTAEQTLVARAGVASAERNGVGKDGAVIVIAAGLVESELRNLNYGDRDSLGWLQQRPSQGWANARDVDKAADDFFADMTGRVKNWRAMQPGDAAQAVQRSKYPTRYAARVPQARSIVDALSGATTPCKTSAPQPVGDCPATSSPAESGLQDAALRGLRCTVKAWPGIGDHGGKGGRPNASDHPSGRAVDYGIPKWRNPQGRAYGWDVARWVETAADSQNVTYIIWDARIWKARTGKWETYTHPNGPTTNPTLLHLDHVHVSYKDSP